ncbi:uncharacterized protein [Zea mays]|uniref:uncharacterized protein n=1 Tax=Zea mays TaxID=4577 RepID=UPI0009AADDBC|nr:uncharacterized protein LOC103648191 [Zea mays]|eukprot:XP_020393580.1 uncharacterized protein LOC103648191 [Zea mays]
MPPSSLSRAPIKFQQRAPPPIYAAPTLRAVGSLFCGAPWTARRRRPPCARCFAQPPIAPSKTVLVVDAALRALPVRRNAKPCGQPMRLVTTRSGPRDDDRASNVVIGC